MILQVYMVKYMLKMENGKYKVFNWKEMDNIEKYGLKLLKIIDIQWII